ncbi:MAG: hypothetical protein MUP66_03240 [Candidatus Nanohaloarchaeota archaeon QJJ-5]|nr:hypothetical protein [Candidatus Nanohaloarchaeota archaeon QJJ-5]
MTHGFLPTMYGIAAIFGVLFIIFMVRSLYRMGRIGTNPRQWKLFAVGFVLIGLSPLLEYYFVREFVWFVFYAYGVYFAIGNVLVLLVLYEYWRSMEA